jgi:hypothetical protein
LKTLPIALTLLVGVLLSSSGLLVTHAYSSNPTSSTKQTLSLGLQGVITSAGTQSWSLSGGNLVGASFGQEQVPPGANIQYSVQAKVTGLSATGSLQLSVSGTTADGQSISVTANGQIVGMIPSICFPSYSSPDANGNCPTTDTSAIPAFFEAPAIVNETLGSTSTITQEVLLVEAPIMNPWSAPIMIGSTDGSINIVATYQTGTAMWSNVQLFATVSGTMNTHQVSGSLVQTTSAYENFVTGNEYEFGTTSFQNMSPSSLNAKGYYWGTSLVPNIGGYDCSALAGLPEGTCTETGLTSSGSFVMAGQSTSGNSWFGSGSTISGTYAITWPAPSVTFSGTIAATVTSR